MNNRYTIQVDAWHDNSHLNLDFMDQWENKNWTNFRIFPADYGMWARSLNINIGQVARIHTRRLFIMFIGERDFIKITLSDPLLPETGVHTITVSRKVCEAASVIIEQGPIRDNIMTLDDMLFYYAQTK